MTRSMPVTLHDRYARAISASKKARWDIDDDVIRGRTFDRSQKFLPDGLSLTNRLGFLTAAEQRFMSQVQGRTYARMFGLVERFINAKVIELGQRHVLGDQVALEALVRFSDEELKHQELFRRIEALIADGMPGGYRFVLDADAVARDVLEKPTWAVLALTCLIELFSQAHYKESIAPDPELSELFRDVFRFHWMEESQHALLDELEWMAEDARVTPEERDRGVLGLIELVGAVDGLVQAQARSDADYFIQHCGRASSLEECDRVGATFVEAYRYQYVHSGVEKTRFPKLLAGFLDDARPRRSRGRWPRCAEGLRRRSARNAPYWRGCRRASAPRFICSGHFAWTLPSGACRKPAKP